MNQMELSTEGISALHDHRLRWDREIDERLLRWDREIDEWLKYPIKDSVLPTELKSKKTVYLVHEICGCQFTKTLCAFTTKEQANTLARKREESNKTIGVSRSYSYEIQEVELL